MPDIYTIISIKRVLNQKGRIVLFPEGMSSISGANQPIALGTAKLLKHLSVPVYSMVIKGGYLTNTKYNLTQRRGRVEVIVDKLFEPDEINTMDEEAITSKINNTLYHDDFAWNQDNKISYQGFDKLAENIGDLLYLCPRCFAQHSIIGVGNDIVCHKCGPLAHLENTYELVPLGTDYQMPETISGWHRFQREQMREEIKDPSFELKAEIELGILPDTEYLTDQATSLIVGSGLLTLNHQGLAYVGTKNHQPFSFFIKISDLPTYGMCTDISRFYTFLNGEFHEFYPRVNHVMRWFIATEELHRYHGGLWSDFNFLKKY